MQSPCSDDRTCRDKEETIPVVSQPPFPLSAKGVSSHYRIVHYFSIKREVLLHITSYYLKLHEIETRNIVYFLLNISCIKYGTRLFITENLITFF